MERSRSRDIWSKDHVGGVLSRSMIFTGIDLAAEPKHTGMATLREADRVLLLEAADVGVSDGALIQAVQNADGTGVDVPIGWPQRFVELVQHHAAATLEPPESTDTIWRRSLAMRATDTDTQRRTGLTPLSVSANLIAYPAFRWAGIEATLRKLGVDMSRDGSGAVAEVYPAAALYRWGLPHRSYKGPTNIEVRQHIVDAVPKIFPTFDWNGFDGSAMADDNVLDAVLAALVAQQIAKGNCEGPAAQHRDVAQVEGWIWIPKTPD